ncbi:beta-eliminating lyase-related protein [Streptomyces caniscabiei]|uniref:beta-eliminating lyase-related protein n=1 Tax=Streptomyces caniscabiei TaxID=2746961 RepID=UPI0038D3D090
MVVDEAHDPVVALPFKGNVDIGKLERLIKQVGAEQIPSVSVAATVNMAGGQPINMVNLAEVRELTCRHRIPVILDAARAVENAWFIQQREPGWGDRSVAEILRAMCDLTDGAVMSAKKDSFANIGGWLGVRDPALAEQARGLVVVHEGLHTYGGWPGGTWRRWPRASRSRCRRTASGLGSSRWRIWRRGSAGRGCRSFARWAGTRCSWTPPGT